MKKELKPYRFMILRFVPDVVTQEFLNVGVLFFAKDGSFASGKFQTRYKRINQLNPKISGKNLVRILKNLKVRTDVLSDQLTGHESLVEFKTVGDLARLIVGKDDSSLQWSEESAGLCSNYEEELISLYTRLVAYSENAQTILRRSSDDVWRDFKRDLQVRNWLHHFQAKRIVSTDNLSLEFKHSLKNGIWHCVQPLSFDFSSEDYIKEKAHKWIGQVFSVCDSEDKFKIYFLIAEPSDPSLQGAFESAKKILRKAPTAVQVFGESESELLINSLQDAVSLTGDENSGEIH